MEQEEVTIEEEKIVQYPIAELFSSIQGEGHHVGRPFAFIRLAGCSVGRPDRAAALSAGLAEYNEICKTSDGRAFFCDTNFRMSAKWTMQSILDWVEDTKLERVCLTGGEPLMHDIKPLVDSLRRRQKYVHIETSGTIAPSWLLTKTFDSVWVSVSPKEGCLPSMIYRANEIKLLVDSRFEPNRIPGTILSKDMVFLQPIDILNPLQQRREPQDHERGTDNTERCLELLKRYPRWRLSVQLHKFLNVR